MNVENEVVKNVEYEQDGVNKKIVQSILKISNSNVDNKLPVQSSHLEIDIPQIPGMNLIDKKIDANKLSFSQGTEDSNVQFDEGNYRIDDKVIVVDVSSIEGETVKQDNFAEDIYTLTFMYEGTSNTEYVEGKVKVKVVDSDNPDHIVLPIEFKTKAEYDQNYFIVMNTLQQKMEETSIWKQIINQLLSVKQK